MVSALLVMATSVVGLEEWSLPGVTQEEARLVVGQESLRSVFHQMVQTVAETVLLVVPVVSALAWTLVVLGVIPANHQLARKVVEQWLLLEESGAPGTRKKRQSFDMRS